MGVLFSACMIVRNEEKFLEKSLASVRDFADETVIGDTGSTDRTPEIARDWGARLFHIPWNNDFSAVRNAVLEQARGAWIISIDADEQIRPFSKADIFPAFSDKSKKAFYTFFLHKKKLTPRHALRIFRNDPRIRYSGIIHENIKAGLYRAISEDDGEIGVLPIMFDHFGYEANQAQKHRRNLPLLLEALKRSPENTNNLRHLGVTYNYLGQTSLAEKIWGKAVSIISQKERAEPVDALPFIDLVKSLQNNGKTARPLLDKALEVFPDNPSLCFLNGRELMSEKRFPEAILSFKRLLKWGEEKDYDRSISYDKRIFNAYAFISLAGCYFFLGKFFESRWYCEKALRHNSADFGIKTALNLLFSLKQPYNRQTIQEKEYFSFSRTKITGLSEDAKISSEEIRRVFAD